MEVPVVEAPQRLNAEPATARLPLLAAVDALSVQQQVGNQRADSDPRGCALPACFAHSEHAEYQRADPLASCKSSKSKFPRQHFSEPHALPE